MAISPLAGKPAPNEIFVDLARLEREYFERRPDMGDPDQLVSFGTSGHQGSSLRGTSSRRPWRRTAQSGTLTTSSRGPSRIMRKCCSSTSAAIHEAGKPIDRPLIEWATRAALVDYAGRPTTRDAERCEFLPMWHQRIAHRPRHFSPAQ
jgi:hypothetical protein